MPETYLLNIGNTHVQVARLVEGKMDRLRRLDTAALLRTGMLAELENTPGAIGFAACVVPAVAELLRRQYPLRVSFLTPAMVQGVDFSAVDVDTVGADRLANVAAAQALGISPAVIVDCGTAITTEVLDRDCRFLGGVIMPGRRLARQALRDHTALLPMVELSSTEFPAPWGHNTVAAIRTGIDLGLVAAIGKLVGDSLERLGGGRALATGGDAPFFISKIPLLEPVPEHFTLSGLAYVLSRRSIQG